MRMRSIILGVVLGLFCSCRTPEPSEMVPYPHVRIVVNGSPAVIAGVPADLGGPRLLFVLNPDGTITWEWQ